MTPEERFQKIEDNLVVAVELQRRNEQSLKEYHAENQRQHEIFWKAMDALNKSLQETRDQLDALIRHSRGQRGNGHE